MAKTCRGDFWTAEGNARCESGSQDFNIHLDCERFGFPTCMHGNKVSSLDNAPCELTEFDTGNKQTRCTGIGSGPPSRSTGSRFQPLTCVHFLDGLTDSDGDSEPFFATEAYRTFLRLGSLKMEYEPCTPELYCEEDSCVSWITRLFKRVVNSKHWIMECNEVEKCDRGSSCDQMVRTPFSFITELGGSIGFMFFSMTAQPSCFGPLQDTFCYLSLCPPDGIDRVMDCIGSVGHGIRARALDRLFVEMDIGYNSDSPFVYGVDTELVNAMFHHFNKLIDQLDSPGHSSTQNWLTSNSISRWTHAETFDENNPGQTQIYPAVEGGPDFYSDYTDQPVLLHARLLAANLDLPCFWTFQSCDIVANLHTEAVVVSQFSSEYRLTGNVVINVQMRIRMSDEAYTMLAGTDFEFVNPQNPYDLRVRRISDPTKAETIFVVTPRGSTIWQQRAGITDGLSVRWEGLKTTQELSVGPNSFQPTCLAGGAPCCGTLQCIDSQLISGKSNDNTGLQESGEYIPREQRYVGSLGFTVPGLNGVGGSPFGCQCA